MSDCKNIFKHGSPPEGASCKDCRIEALEAELEQAIGIGQEWEIHSIETKAQLERVHGVQRYELFDVEGGVGEEEDSNGDWMKAGDILKALKDDK